MTHVAQAFGCAPFVPQGKQGKRVTPTKSGHTGSSASGPSTALPSASLGASRASRTPERAGEKPALQNTGRAAFVPQAKKARPYTRRRASRVNEWRESRRGEILRYAGRHVRRSERGRRSRPALLRMTIAEQDGLGGRESGAPAAARNPRSSRPSARLPSKLGASPSFLPSQLGESRVNRRYKMGTRWLRRSDQGSAAPALQLG